TDLARIGSRLPDDWLAQLARTPGNPARNAALAPTATEAFTANTILNSFGQPAGYAILRYSREPERTALRAFTTRLAITCAIMFGAFTVLLYAALAWMWRRTDRDLVWAADALFGGAEEAQAKPAPVLVAEVAAIRARLSALDTGLDRVAPRPAEEPF
ncbi:MAG: hypothetical protein JNK75_14210, partial [Betaproteobacteria bacterium]|nr:hypothetical protein [Betaproteobacteria bacterium]